MSGRHRHAIVIAALCLLVTSQLWAHAASPPSIRVAILGDPVHQVKWTDEAMERLKAIGFNAVQLNIAWGARPFDEALNLIDVVTVPGEDELPGTAERRAELERRVDLAGRHGLRTLFHFGSPYMDRNPNSGETRRIRYHVDNVTFDSKYDILNPKVRDHELALLREFRTRFPKVDDILVYTYDQDAWQTPEFQYTKFSWGIPLSERLPGYLAALHKVWTQGRSGKARMWWEPWELSPGQIYAALPKLPRTDFGLMLHSNIAEVQLALPADVWFRNTVRMSRELGIPVVAEGVFSSTPQEIEPLSIPAPRLVDEQYLALTHEPGIVGIKEYFGINTDAPDLNLDLLQARLRDPTRSTGDLIDDITSRFGAMQAEVRAYLALLSDALQAYPWDASPKTFSAGRQSPNHGWSGATILGLTLPSGTTLSFQQTLTPAWNATRHAAYMRIVDTGQPHFWMLEDVELRCRLAADLLDRATDLSRQLIVGLHGPGDIAQFEQIQRDVDVLRRIARSYALHLRQTNVTAMLRQDLEAGRPMTSALRQELGRLLDLDVSNQNGKGRVVEMRELYRDDPEAFIRRYLDPEKDAEFVSRPESVPQSLTTRP